MNNDDKKNGLEYIGWNQFDCVIASNVLFQYFNNLVIVFFPFFIQILGDLIFFSYIFYLLDRINGGH